MKDKRDAKREASEEIQALAEQTADEHSLIR